MKILPVIITTFALLVSCEKSAQSTATPVSTETKTADNDSATTENVAQNAPAPPSGTIATTTSAPAAATSTSGKPALNPAHGEPHHRCDIAVGAPIDSQPATPNVASQAVQKGNAPANTFNTSPIAPTNAPSSAAPVTATGPKPALNPAHGEPHHRCDLQVGAPLT